MKRKTRVRKHVIADMSLYHLGFLITSSGFTLEPTRADYGYDVSVFTFDGSGQYENGNVFVQLKATDTLRRDPKSGDVKFRIGKRDIMTWESEPFPAYLVVFDAQAGAAYAIYLQRYFQQNGISSGKISKGSVDVRLPGTAIDLATVAAWRVDKNAVLTGIGAVTHV